MFTSFFYFILLSITLPSSLQHLNIPLKLSEYLLFDLEVCIGEPKKCNDISLSLTETNLIIFDEFKYEPMKSMTSLSSSEWYTLVWSDKIYFYGNSEMFCFEEAFFSLGERTGRRNGYLGLGYNEAHFSHILKKLFEKAGGKQVFYIDPDEKTLTFGKYPDLLMKYEKEERKIKQCDMVGEEGYYCQFDSVFFKNSKSGESKQYEVERKATFNPSASMIYTSKSFISFITEHYLRDAIEKNKCKTVNEEDKVFIQCKNSYDYLRDNTLSDITFIFDKISIRLNKKDLFREIKGELYFLVAYDSYFPEWTFGYPIIQKYIMLFDIDERKISFVPKED